MKKTSRMNVPVTFETMAQSAFFLVIGTGASRNSGTREIATSRS